MFNELGTNEDSKSREKETNDDNTRFTIILGTVFVMLPFLLIGKIEIGLSVGICLGASYLVVKLNWRLRKHFWFRAAIALAFLVELPLALIIPWHAFRANKITILPFLVIAWFVTYGVVKLFETFFGKASSSVDEEL